MMIFMCLTLALLAGCIGIALMLLAMALDDRKHKRDNGRRDYD